MLPKVKALKPRYKRNLCAKADLRDGNENIRDLIKRFRAISVLTNIGHAVMQASLVEQQIIVTGK